MDLLGINFAPLVHWLGTGTLNPWEVSSILTRSTRKKKMVKASYIATYSDRMRLAMQFSPASQQKVQTLVEDVVNTISDAEDIAASLKGDVDGLFKSLRQIDMKNEDEQVILKTFTGWNKQLNCWHVFVEFPTENFWEKGRTIGKG